MMIPYMGFFFYNEEKDMFTGYPITPDIFQENLKKNNVNKKNINLIKQLSTENNINLNMIIYADMIIMRG